MSGYDSGESCDAYSERLIHAARKAHVCSACRGDIRPGDRYSYTSIVFEGEVQVIKRCVRCEYIYQTLCNDLKAGRLTDGEYIEPRLDCGHRYDETHSEPMPEHLARVAFMTADELQALDFGAIEAERERLRLERELASARSYEVWCRTPGEWEGKAIDLEHAARCNARTCELERRLGL